MAEIDRFILQRARMRTAPPHRRPFAYAAWLPIAAATGATIAVVAVFGGPADNLGRYADKIAAGQDSGSAADSTGGQSSGGQSSGEIVGPADVVDGDTIKIGGERIRFFGIDAPESSQQCRDATGANHSCGQEAAALLENMIHGQTVRCQQRETDQYGRAVAICTANGTDLNGALVEAGLAVAYRYYSNLYIAREDNARQARRGLWAGTFEMPSDYRHGRR